MNTTRCSRCDWHSDPEEDQSAREQLDTHALGASHPLCCVCHRSLPDTDPRTCEKCLTKVREHLAEVVELYALLPSQLGHPAAQVYDRDGRGGGDGAPLPGGPALVMLGPGGSGTEPRRLTSKEQLLGVEGREHSWDNLDTDGVSVAYALHQWEIYWREIHDEPTTTNPTVLTAASYLERRMRWAADNLDVFPDFAAELRALRVQMQTTTGRSDRPVRAPAVCFDCGEDSLERKWNDAGLADVWTCARCHRVYEQADYWLAVRAKIEGASPKPPASPRPRCSSCGNTKCPHAWHARYLCTGSNEPGQTPRLAPEQEATG